MIRRRCRGPRRERHCLIFDEELGLLFARMKNIGIDLSVLQDSGNLLIEQVDAAELSPGGFPPVRRCVDQGDIKTVVIDSINGYQAAMPEENALVLDMHQLLLTSIAKGRRRS